MVGALLLVPCLDEWFAPWFPVWFILALIVMGSASLELVALLGKPRSGRRATRCSPGS